MLPEGSKVPIFPALASAFRETQSCGWAGVSSLPSERGETAASRESTGFPRT